MTVFAPEDLRHFCGTGLKLGLVLVPDVTCSVESLHATNALQDIRTKLSGIGGSHTTLIAECGAGGEKGNLSLYGLSNLPGNETSGLVTKHEVVAREVCTQSHILGRDLTLILNVLILKGEQRHGTVAVGETLLHTVGERSTGLVEVRATVLRSRQQGNTVEYTVIGITTMSLQQIIIEDRAKAESLTLQTIDEHLLLRSCTGSPGTGFHDLEEVIDILDTILAIVPLGHRVVVGGPCTSSHSQITTGLQVGNSIICGNIGLRGRDIRKTIIAIHQQTMCIRGLFGQVFHLSIVLICGLKHVIA